MSVGEAGYISSCHSIVGATKSIIQAISASPSLSTELSVLGRPLVSVVAFTSKSLDVYDIADAMSAKGWHLNSLQDPPRHSCGCDTANREGVGEAGQGFGGCG